MYRWLKVTGASLALTPGQPFVRQARFEQAGTFRARGDSWVPFTAVEHFSVRPPGFVWDAQMRMAPLVLVHVRDSYMDGEGSMEGRLAALVPVVDQRGPFAMASGALVRYLAESVWLPTALLPSAGVEWSAISDSAARATLFDGSTTVSLDVFFGPRGEIVRASTARYRDVNGHAVLTPWVCHFADYERMDGMMVPRSGSVEWVLPQGTLPYWRGRIERARYRYE